MKVIRAGTLGFCKGVRRAVELAVKAIEAADRRVYTLGPLIHNHRVLEDLRLRGVEVLEDRALPPAPERAAVIIRAHGAPPQKEDELRALGVLVIDATCPKVKASQLKARALAKKGFFIFLAGEEHHAELAGIRGYAESAGGLCRIVGSAAEAEAAARELGEAKAGAALIGQTTITAEEFRTIGEGIKKHYPDLKIINTICEATRERQDSLRELCAGVGGVIIAGDRQSANTRRLEDIAVNLGKPARLVEAAGDITREVGSWGTAGLCAGTSTPDGVIDEIEKALEAL
ncbi:MAG: 4-hydroxy-3-methylbut-2-enyl diphosphate reductase [Treponema sp.]|jgi:4-hydroxy-3-methylbut-2-enyl diphosphate reductase|nr:4-hydroxy-3-methylbut-2-enyl diphosphate reductase [Treponema sp.]